MGLLDKTKSSSSEAQSSSLITSGRSSKQQQQQQQSTMDITSNNLKISGNKKASYSFYNENNVEVRKIFNY
jgi:hypothetical protein